jgi:serine palmitoyltransferase
MGSITDSGYSPIVMSKGCPVIYEELNHALIRFGCQNLAVHVQMFQYNDVLESLEYIFNFTVWGEISQPD